MPKKLSTASVGVCILSIFVVLTACRSDKVAGIEKISPQVPLALRPFPLQNVRLLDGPFKQAMDRNTRYLRDLDSGRMLHNFRLTAGLPSTAQPLGGLFGLVMLMER